MHLLNVQPGAVDDGEAVDIRQSPADIVVLSAADTELATMAAAHAALGPEAPSLRIVNLLQLRHPMSVDLYVERTVARAKLVVVRLLGGRSYWSYGVEQLSEAARAGGPLLVLLPGDDKPDDDLRRASSVPDRAYDRFHAYFVEGGAGNAANALRYGAHLAGAGAEPPEPAPLLRAGLYWPGLHDPSPAELRARWRPGRPLAAVTFYRALLQSGQTETVDALVAALDEAGLNALPLYAQSFKDAFAGDVVKRTFQETPPDVLVNLTGFALGTPGGAPGGAHAPTLFDGPGGAVLQAVMAGSSETAWTEGTRGLGVRDIAMNVALPEVDGRIVTRAVAFKAEARFDAVTEAPIVVHRPRPDRVAFVAGLAANWAALRHTPASEKRIALVLANYPNRDGRIGNGVGLDTPESAAAIVSAMSGAGHDVGAAPQDGSSLMAMLLAGPTNAGGPPRFASGERLSLDEYERFFNGLEPSVQETILARWGAPRNDPFVCDGAFRLPVHRFGNLAIGIQPARGYNIDPKASYHDPDLPPPHGYLAFYAWIRQSFEAHAAIQAGKHGNLEWLPGKGLALSAECLPEAVLGPLPLVYPFIVNDPGEGAQAKRRAAAVVVDHLTPPLTRAETYGPLKDLEALVDEYFDAVQGDARRARALMADILAHARATGLDADCGIEPDTTDAEALTRLDAHLCDLKELQIRDGLHVFGSAPDGERLDRLLVALARVPRAAGEAGDASIVRALAADLELYSPEGPAPSPVSGCDGAAPGSVDEGEPREGEGSAATARFDPLACDMAAAWTGPRTDALAAVSPDPWRICGDTVERLELLAEALVDGRAGPPPGWTATRAVLDEIEARFRPAVLASGAAEIGGVVAALEGRFVPPGPSGAPTRGRPEVLPTGRNFYSVDSRAVPTPTAYALGRKSAELLVEDYRQRNGEWLKAVALSAWGTANMRTGGDDVAQALALVGARPVWEPASGRVTGFAILPPGQLGRPRVDVTFRASGFFRDAFPAQMELFDAAVRAVAALDEEPADNPLAARVAEDAARLAGQGLPPDEARRKAATRVFSSKPGAYGAGLQALIDESGWQTRADFAAAYLAWGAFAYGGGAEGDAEPALFRDRLAGVEAVVQNQDNREHDLLDSDDYYQFEGGLAAAVEAARGARPTLYHNDHSRPETPKVRTLEEEIARVVRARAANPKWIAGVMRHGYKGAFEIAATVDYLFAFQATTGAVAHHHFDLLFDAYLGDDEVRGFIAEANAPALAEIADRFSEALERGLWQPRSNRVHDVLQRIRKAAS